MGIDVYQIVTDRILEQLDKGIVPWRKTWNGNDLPMNYVTRKYYRGINRILLPLPGEYLSFKQCKDLGGHVRKGEKGHIIAFYKPMEVEDKDTNEKKMIPFLKYSTVFHLSQTEGIQSKLEQEQDIDTDPIAEAEAIIAGYINRSGITVNHVSGSDSAYYQPSTDTATLPVIKQFNNPEAYYGVAFHEYSHSTGHKYRLNRITDNAAFGSENYSKEELVAEISSCMIMNIAGLEIPETFENSCSYIARWSKRVKEDRKLIVQASSKAQLSADMILGVNGGDESSE